MKIGDRYSKRRKAYNIAGRAYEMTFSCYRNRNFLSKDRVCRWLVESIERTRVELDYALWAYVFMPNHVHLLIRPRQGIYSIDKYNPVKKGLVETPELWYYSSAAVWKQLRNDPMSIDMDEWPV